MKKYLIAIITIILSNLFLMSSSSAVLASPGEFSFNPSTGYVHEGEDFIIDVLIDTNGTEVIRARSVILFDPTLVQVEKAERNNTMFAQYPEDEQSVDNTNGVIVLSGFSQSGANDLYQTLGEAEVFARITFTAVRAGNVEFEWQYSGADEAFETIILEDGSPPQNIMTATPDSSFFTIQGATSGDTPNTGIFDKSALYVAVIMIIGAIFVTIGGVVYSKKPKKLSSKKYRTVVDMGRD